MQNNSLSRTLRAHIVWSSTTSMRYRCNCTERQPGQETADELSAAEAADAAHRVVTAEVGGGAAADDEQIAMIDALAAAEDAYDAAHPEVSASLHA